MHFERALFFRSILLKDDAVKITDLSFYHKSFELDSFLVKTVEFLCLRAWAGITLKHKTLFNEKGIISGSIASLISVKTALFEVSKYNVSVS